MGEVPWYCALPVRRALLIQATATLVGSGFAWMVSPSAGVSVCLGGAICLVSTAYSGAKVFGKTIGTPEDALAGLYRAEIGKLVIAGGLLFVALTCVDDLNFIALCVAFVAIQMCGSIAAAWAPNAPERRT
ncbi:MAG: F0F1-type ATP synthase assembly protein I [Gammaproteobacteria bacterium]|jgi:F0F1-type ATP synthase assembly protein I